jgi:MFS family permease
MTASSSRFYGWIVVAAAFVVAVFGWGVGFYGPPIFLQAVRDTRGWSVALVSGAITVHFLAGAVAVANLPKLYRTFGLAPVTVAGSVSLASGVAGWAFAVEPWQLFVATLFSGVGWVALGAAGINAMVSPWFNRRRPAALSTAYNGASAGGIIFSPLWVALITWGGFPMASVSVGIVMIAVIVLMSAHVLRHTPESMGVAPDGDEIAVGLLVSRAPVANFWCDRAFLTLALGMSLGLFAQIGLIAHLFSMLAPAMGKQGAGLAAGLAAASAILGRTLVGCLLPPDASRRAAGALNHGVQIIGCCVFVVAGGGNIPLLLLGVLLLGVGIGNATSIPPLIAQAEFAKADVVRVVAQVTAVAQASYAFAPALFGMIRELTASDDNVAVPVLFIAAAGFQLAAAAAYWMGRDSFRMRTSEIRV